MLAAPAPGGNPPGGTRPLPRPSHRLAVSYAAMPCEIFHKCTTQDLTPSLTTPRLTRHPRLDGVAYRSCGVRPVCRAIRVNIRGPSSCQLKGDF